MLINPVQCKICGFFTVWEEEATEHRETHKELWKDEDPYEEVDATELQREWEEMGKKD